MTPDALHVFCLGLPAATHVVQWGNSDVYKVGGKVFAIAGWNKDDHLAVTFKVPPAAFEILKEQPGCRGAPYLASRGMSWIQRYDPSGMNDAALKDYIRQSHGLVAQGLSKKRRRELGLSVD